LIATFFFAMTPLLISVQWLLDKLKLPGGGVIATFYYRVLCRLLRIHIRVVGEPAHDRAMLFVSNHVSWIDILVIGSIAPVAFVAKRSRQLATGRRHRTATARGIRRSHIGAVKEASSHTERNILIQPMSIGHTDLHGIPVGRQHRPLVVWYGDLDFMPHIKAFVARGAVNAVVSYGSRPTPYPTAKPRRNRCGAVRALNAATVRGRPRTAHATTS
jgi:1-acyl-sn-glycerol-3-phosphate acyltransferase